MKNKSIDNEDLKQQLLASKEEKLQMQNYILEIENQLMKENYLKIKKENETLKESKEKLERIEKSRAYKLAKKIKCILRRNNI